MGRKSVNKFQLSYQIGGRLENLYTQNSIKKKKKKKPVSQSPLVTDGGRRMTNIKTANQSSATI